jgi:diketogulonate reductase-like aldo/keto reductase
VALNWCISKNGVVAILKSNSADHVKENNSSSAFELPKDVLERLDTEIQFRHRGRVEVGLRIFARYIFQLLGREQ